MRIPIAIYPYCSELLPIVKYFEQVQDKYSISRLVSPPGLGLGGKDAAHARNHPNIGHTVIDKFNADDTSWEILFLTKVSKANAFDNDKVLNIAESTILAGKKVIYFDDSQRDIPAPLLTLSESHPSGITIVTENIQSYSTSIDDMNFNIFEVPIIIIGGLIAVEDTLEVLVSLTDCLEKQGFNPLAISKSCHSKMLGDRYHYVGHVFDDVNLSERDKIKNINSYIKGLEQKKMPDIMLVEAPDSVMRFKTMIPHDFGIHTFMLCQAAMPDYFVCCIPCDLAVDDFLTEISKGLLYRLGTGINAVHVSNIIIDSSDIKQSKIMPYIHVSINEVQKQIKDYRTHSKIPLFDVVTEGTAGICSALLKQNDT